MRNGSTLWLLQLLPRLYLRCMLQRPSESESGPARRTPPPSPPYVVSVCRGRGGEVIPRFNRLTLSTELFHAWQSLIQFIIFKYMAKLWFSKAIEYPCSNNCVREWGGIFGRCCSAHRTRYNFPPANSGNWNIIERKIPTLSKPAALPSGSLKQGKMKSRINLTQDSGYHMKYFQPIIRIIW